MSRENEKKVFPSDELRKSVDLWLQWDQCQSTREEIEQLKVLFFFLEFSLKFDMNNFLRKE